MPKGAPSPGAARRADVREAALAAAVARDVVCVAFTRENTAGAAVGTIAVVDARSIRVESAAGLSYVIPIAFVSSIEVIERRERKEQRGA
jgi:hypothetical protein